MVKQQIKIHNGGKGAGILEENLINKRILSELVSEKKKMLKLKRRILKEKKKVKKNTVEEKKKTEQNKKDNKKRKLKVMDKDHHQDEGAENSKKDSIFGIAYHQIIDLSTYKIYIKMNGLSPLDSGRNSLISSTMYNQIKTMINIDKQSSLQTGQKLNEERGLFSSGDWIISVGMIFMIGLI